MSEIKRSETLNKKLDSETITVAECNQKIKQLESYGFPQEALDHFKARLFAIVEKNPQASDIVTNELDKTIIVAQNNVKTYNRAFRTIVSGEDTSVKIQTAAEDYTYIEDIKKSA